MKKYISIFLIAILTLGLVACDEGTTQTKDEPEKIEVEDDNNEVVDEPEDDEPEKVDDENNESTLPSNIEEKEVTLYFVNREYIESGREDLDKYIPLEMIIEVEDGAIAEAIVNALIAGPSEKFEDVENGIPEGLKLIDLNLKDGLLYINLSSEGLHGGSLDEELLIGQMVNSLLELSTVEGVQFMVNGEIAESLMGHYDTSEPYTETLK